VIIAGLVALTPLFEGPDRLYAYAIGVLAGTVVQLAMSLPPLRRLGIPLRFSFAREARIGRVLRLMLPVSVGLGLINIDLLLNSAIGSLVSEAAPRAIDAAFRIYMLPQGMFSVAVATVLFPALARLAARSDTDGFRRTVGLGLRQIAFLLVPASVVSAVLAEPIVRLLYERGEFGPHETDVVAGALAAFSLGLVFNGAMLMLNRAFFSLQSPWLPTWVALGNLLLNTILFAAFYRLGTWGIPLAISLANVAGTAALLYLLRRRFGRIEGGETARSTSLITVASAVLGIVALAVWWALDDALGRSFGGQLVSLSTALAVGAAAYVFSCRLLGVRELNALLSLRARSRPAA
jgi:putative peptidoglycan lipid II flippase